jgi:hypothetical protein
MADEAGNREAFRIQEHYCSRNAAPIYGRICAAIADGLTRDSAVGRRILDWPGEPTRDALPLRFMGGLHALVLAGKDDGLARVFGGEIVEPDAVMAAVNRVAVEHDATLLRWLDGPPQTNEPGRSGALIVGLMEIARRHGPKLEVLEIGSSAGLNLLIDRYAFDLGGVRVGPSDSPVTIAPEWRGSPPAPVALEIVSTRGCDVQPLDATDPAVSARLLAYVWPETPMRVERLGRAIEMQREKGVDLTHADAADWLEVQLAQPQAEGVTRVLMHSVVWQYLPEDSATRIRSAMAKAAVHATTEQPLGWVMMEPDRALGHQLLRVRSWPGHDAWQTIASAHAHAAWVDTVQHQATDGYDLPEAARVTAG